MSGQARSPRLRGSDAEAKHTSAALTPAEERLADAVAERVVASLRPVVPQLLTRAEVASLLHVRPEWVSRHKDELGAVNLGDESGPLRFPAEIVTAYLGAGQTGRRPQPDAAPAAKPKPRRRRRASSGADRPLLPYPGDGKGK